MAAGDIETFSRNGIWFNRIQGESHTLGSSFESMEEAVKVGRGAATARQVQHFVRTEEGRPTTWPRTRRTRATSCGESRMILQACVNGARDVAEHPWLSADETVVAQDAAAAVDAGATEIHVHPKNAGGRDSLAPEDVQRWLGAVRAAAPGVPVGVTTGAWAEPDVARRIEAIEGWTELPDYASVNWHEAGADGVAAALHRRGIGVEAGIWDAAGLEAWRVSPVRGACLRVLVELPAEAADIVRPHAEGLIAHVAREEPDLPILLHGEDLSAWPALDLAAERGLDTRIGLEDTLLLPDGAAAPSNAALVRAARSRLPRS